MDISKLFGIKQYWEVFKGNHPKLLPIIAQLGEKEICEGQEIAIAVRYPDGTEIKTGIRLQQSDLPLFETLKEMAK